MTSQDVDRNQVFETTRVRTLLKKDSSWIHSPGQTGKGRESTECPVETKPTVNRQSSYVSSTAQKFESPTLPLSPPPQKTQFKPSEGVSGYHAKTDVVPSPKDAQPEASTMEAADKTKPHVPTEELLLNGNAEVSLTNEKSEAVSLVQQNDQPKSKSTKERLEENIEKATEGLTEVSAAVCVKDLVVEPSAEAGTEQNKDASKVFAVSTGEQKPEKRHSAETNSANVTNLQNTGEESAMQTAKGAYARDAPREGSETVAIKASDVTVVETLPETINVTNTAPEDEAVQQITVEQVPDLLADAVSKSPSQTAVQTSVQGSSEEYTTGQIIVEAAKDEEKVVVAAANEIISVTSPTGEDGVPQTNSEEPISESPESAEDDSAQGGSEGCPTGQLGAETAETETKVVVESSTDIPVVTDVGHEEVALCPDSKKPTSDLEENSALKSPTPAAAESNIDQCFVVVAEPVETVDDEVESSPEIPAVTDVVLEGAVVQDNVEPGPDLLGSCISAPPAQFADVTVTETVKAEAEVQVSPETPVVNNTTPEKDPGPVSLAEGVSQSLVEPSVGGSGVINPSVVAVGEAVEVVTEAVVESPKETSCLDTDNLSSDSQADAHSVCENCELCPETIEAEVKSDAPQGCVEPGPESLAEVCPSRQVAGESAEVATAVAAVVESSPDMPTVTDVAPEDVSSQCIVEPEPDSAEPVSESHTQSSAQDSNEGCPAVHDRADTAESVRESVSAVTDVAHTQEAFCETHSVKTTPDLQANTEESSESSTQPASVAEVVEALAEALVPSLPMTPAESNTVPGEGGSVQNSVEPGPDSLASAVDPAAEMNKAGCPSGGVSSESKGVVESSLETSAVTDAAQPDASDIQTKDALEPKPTSDSVQSKLAERAIELTDALDEVPSAEAQCVKDPKQSSKEDSKVEQGPNDTNITKTLEKPEENQGPAETQSRDEEVCSLCAQTFGIIRIRITHPSLILHPDCFKCGVCGKVLGDLLTPMYLLKEVIHCDTCHA